MHENIVSILETMKRKIQFINTEVITIRLWPAPQSVNYKIHRVSIPVNVHFIVNRDYNFYFRRLFIANHNIIEYSLVISYTVPEVKL